MQNIGVDIGYSFTKTSAGVIFPSKIQQSNKLLCYKNDIEFDKKRYSVGVGNDLLELNKIETELTLVCMFYAILTSTNDEFIYISTGLPVNQYKTQKEQLKDYIMRNNKKTVTYKGIQKSIYIKNVFVFPQGGGSLFASNIKNDCIIIDIGGRTVDIVMFQTMNSELVLTKYTTLFNGMISLYSQLIKEINEKYCLSLTYDDAERIISQGLKIFNNNVDLKWLKPIFQENVSKTLKELTLNYPYSTMDIYLCGGGANVLYDFYREKVPNIKLFDNSQFSNAIGFKRLGDSMI